MKLFTRGKVLLAGLAAVLGLSIGAGTTAHATTWHKGVPTAIRGTWKTHSIAAAGTHYRLQLKIGKDSITNGGGFGDPTWTNHQSYHHKSGSAYYYVKGHEKVYTGGKEVIYYKFHKVGSKLHMMNYLVIQHGHKATPEHHYSHWYYK
ncbi:hypothetical protein IWT140_00193 [Secundilactobacillus pentosiphilus]|uniref:Extracellular protein n=1 Tax=Secundilactobacillus pentosiphilus TaxID=1714682 RepID=A0A1Z5ILM6_9LACO|nr:hypothetical protein [Secundilactobacillus pentosiphilus]GAX02596.1 hypothetical protein IWT140_00193 [Secundilactobacillus pentosiphilus]